MVWILVGILIFIIIILSIKYSKKTIFDRTEEARYIEKVNHLKQESNDLQADICVQRSLINEYQEKLIDAQNKYQTEFNKQNNDLNEYFNKQREIRQNQLDEDFTRLKKEKEENLQLQLNEYKIHIDKQKQLYEDCLDQVVEEYNARTLQIQKDTEYQEDRFNKLIAPLQQYEKDKQAKLFYTIQVPDEYKEDIDFLLNTVSQKIRHPDIINKLIWAEYVKPYLDDTFKRIEIRAEPGIYKLTNIENGKAYIGKSTDVKKRISDHFKASVKLESIAHQVIHDKILEKGFWNWTIEIITYCEKDKLSELEKYYIDFFKTQEWGYNKKAGG